MASQSLLSELLKVVVSSVIVRETGTTTPVDFVTRLSCLDLEGIFVDTHKKGVSKRVSQLHLEHFWALVLHRKLKNIEKSSKRSFCFKRSL